MKGNQPDFKYLKERVSIQQVLSHYRVELRPAGPGNLRGRCPLPTHTSRVSTASFSVNLPRNVWSCQSASCIAARAGQIGGNVLDLVAAMERCSIRDAGLHMASWFGTQISTPIAPKPLPRELVPAEANPPLGFVLQKIGKRLVNGSSIAGWRASYLRGVGDQAGVLEQADQRAEGPAVLSRAWDRRVLVLQVAPAAAGK